MKFTILRSAVNKPFPTELHPRIYKCLLQKNKVLGLVSQIIKIYNKGEVLKIAYIQTGIVQWTNSIE